MILFIIGHLAADRLQTIKVRTWHTVLGTFLVTAGILLCTIRQAYPIEMLLHTYPIEIFLHRLLPPAVGVQIQGAVLQRMTGALMIFGGLVLLPVLQRQLQRRIPSWLGKVSFSLYLLHFPLEFTVFSACFSKLAERLPMGVSVAVTFVIGIAGSLALAVVFERWVDRPSITLSRMADWTRRRRTGGAMALAVKRIPLGDAAD
jgi:peptidoglycan/LPS O-acetylase OafA/YrhL